MNVSGNEKLKTMALMARITGNRPVLLATEFCQPPVAASATSMELEEALQILSEKLKLLSEEVEADPLRTLDGEVEYEIFESYNLKYLEELGSISGDYLEEGWQPRLRVAFETQIYEILQKGEGG